jgi:hypothetical protein
VLALKLEALQMGFAELKGFKTVEGLQSKTLISKNDQISF